MPESGLKPEVCNLIKETLAQVFSCEFGACNFIIKETLAQVFFCEFCEIFKNTLPRKPPGDCCWNFPFCVGGLEAKGFNVQLI